MGERLPFPHFHFHLGQGVTVSAMKPRGGISGRGLMGGLVVKLRAIVGVEPLWAPAQSWGAGLEWGTPRYLLLENHEGSGILLGVGGGGRREEGRYLCGSMISEPQ